MNTSSPAALAEGAQRSTRRLGLRGLAAPSAAAVAGVLLAATGSRDSARADPAAGGASSTQSATSSPLRAPTAKTRRRMASPLALIRDSLGPPSRQLARTTVLPTPAAPP